jgi:hypothetical protein
LESAANTNLDATLMTASISLFSLFFPKLSASEIAYAAEILGRARSGKRNNSRAPAVLPLSSCCFGAKISGSREHPVDKLLQGSLRGPTTCVNNIFLAVCQ